VGKAETDTKRVHKLDWKEDCLEKGAYLVLNTTNELEHKEPEKYEKLSFEKVEIYFPPSQKGRLKLLTRKERKKEVKKGRKTKK